MSRTVRLVALAVVLLAVVSINLSTASAMVAIEESSCCPCYDIYQSCINGGGSEAYCDGKWCECMKKKYGTTNC